MKNLKRLIISGVTLVLFTSISSLHAQELRIPIGQQGDISITVPKRGLSQEVVRQQFGEPYNAVENIGEPPISTWYYSRFNVYFESGKVIHSVRKTQ